MTEAPMLVAALDIEVEGRTVTGYAGELLVPKWFAKDPASDIADDHRELMRAAQQAFEVMQQHESPDATAFDHWLRAQLNCVEPATDHPPALVAMFGLALVERAIIDALCRATSQSFKSALDADLFGLRFGEIDARLDGWTGANLGRTTSSVRIRHTVGLVDPLEPSDVPPEVRLADDHPICLVDDISTYGLDCFKLKVSGNERADLMRLETIASLTPKSATFTLDGNEQYAEPGLLADVLDELERRGNADSILSGLLAIEQPVARARTFDEDATGGIRRLSERAPVIIDEADAKLTSYSRARALGYGGVSVKACKGVFRALFNRASIDADGRGIQSAEDLTNLPVLPLHQDLSLVAALGLPHVERNGHHYFRGQSHLTEAETRHLQAQHGTLYHVNSDGETLLAIEDGRIDLSSLNPTPGAIKGFGYDGPIDMEAGSTPQL